MSAAVGTLFSRFPDKIVVCSDRATQNDGDHGEQKPVASVLGIEFKEVTSGILHTDVLIDQGIGRELIRSEAEHVIRTVVFGIEYLDFAVVDTNELLGPVYAAVFVFQVLRDLELDSHFFL